MKSQSAVSFLGQVVPTKYALPTYSTVNVYGSVVEFGVKFKNEELSLRSLTRILRDATATLAVLVDPKDVMKKTSNKFSDVNEHLEHCLAQLDEVDGEFKFTLSSYLSLVEHVSILYHAAITSDINFGPFIKDLDYLALASLEMTEWFRIALNYKHPTGYRRVAA